MKRLAIILLALACSAQAQTFITVTADTNRLIRTNFTIQAANISGTVALASNVTSTVALASNLSAPLSVTNGGTGATNATTALANLLPSYSNNATKVLTVNALADGVEWSTNGGGGGGGGVASIDLSGGTTGLTFSGGPITNSGTITVGGTLSVTNGGTGATNPTGALSNLSLVIDERVTIATTNAAGSYSIAIGRLAFAVTNSAVAIGNGAYANESAVALGQSAYADQGYGAAIGYNASTEGFGGAIGFSADATDGGSVGSNAYTTTGGAIGEGARSASGFAGGKLAESSGTGVQLGTGTNETTGTIQFLSAGTIDTNEWARLAALSTYPTTNISVVGTNNTNTLVFSNGILVNVTTP
jgi:hypothetical protein